MVEMKQCSKCKLKKPLSEFSRDKNRKDGLYCWCKKCQVKLVKDWRRKNKEKFRQYRLRYQHQKNPDMKYYIKEKEGKKYCYTCKQWKLKIEFYKRKNGRIFSKCKLCCKKYRQKNREEYNKAHREWYKKNGQERGKDYYKRYIKPWKKAHPEAERARKKLQYNIKHGYIERFNKCEICNQNHRKISAHHPDYDKPLNVIWVCPSCHKNIHLSNLDKIKDINILKEKLLTFSGNVL